MAMLKSTPNTVPLHVLDFLAGYSRPKAEIEAWQAAGKAYDEFFEFDRVHMPAEDFRALFHRHEAAIRLHCQALRRDMPDPARFRPGNCWVR